MKNIGKKSLVSIIIPIHDTQPRFLVSCINSVLNQTYKNIEVILIDDGSRKENTLRIIQRYEKKVKTIIRNPLPMGVSAARNKGLSESCGEFILFIDSDDKINAEYVEKLVPLMDDMIAVVYSSKVVMSEDGKICDEWKFNKKELQFPQDCKELACRDFLFACPGALISRKYVGNTRFEEGMKYGEDIYFMVSVIGQKRFRFQSDSKYYYIQNSNSVTHDYDANVIDIYLSDSFRMIKLITSICSKIEKYSNEMKKRKVKNAIKKVISSKNTIAWKTRNAKKIFEKYGKSIGVVDFDPKWSLLKIGGFWLYCLLGEFKGGVCQK